MSLNGLSVNFFGFHLFWYHLTFFKLGLKTDCILPRKLSALSDCALIWLCLHSSPCLLSISMVRWIRKRETWSWRSSALAPVESSLPLTCWYVPQCFHCSHTGFISLYFLPPLPKWAYDELVPLHFDATQQLAVLSVFCDVAMFNLPLYYCRDSSEEKIMILKLTTSHVAVKALSLKCNFWICAAQKKNWSTFNINLSVLLSKV